MIIDAMNCTSEYSTAVDIYSLGATNRWFFHLIRTSTVDAILFDLKKELRNASELWVRLIGDPTRVLDAVALYQFFSIWPRVSKAKHELLLSKVILGLVWDRTLALQAIAAEAYEYIPKKRRSDLLSIVNSLTDAEEQAQSLTVLAEQVRHMDRDERSQFFQSIYGIEDEGERSEAMARVARQPEYLEQEERCTFLQNVFNLQGEGNLSWLLAILSDKLRWLNSVQREEYFEKAIGIVNVSYRRDVIDALNENPDELSEAERAQILSVSGWAEIEE